MCMPSLIISILSIVIAGAALYFSQLRKAKINAVLGSQIDIYHHDYIAGISTGFVIPVSFVNDSPSTGTILKVAFSLCQKGCEDERYFMQWHKFDYLDEKTDRWGHEEDAHPLVLGPRSGSHKNIWCMWHAFNAKKLFLTKGNYELCMHLWTAERKNPIKCIKTFFVSEEIENCYKELRLESKTNSLKLALDKELEYNKFLNNTEYKKLL